LLHELGHALTALRFGVGIVSITMYPIGGVARLKSQPRPMQEIWITAAGPAVNLVLAAMLTALEDVAGAEWRAPFRDLARSNLLLALFNLLPAFPMDGGRLLRAGLALVRPEIEATRIATNVGRAVAVLMGIYAIVNSQWFLLFIAFIVFTGAQQERVVAESKVLSTGVPVSAAMIRDYRTLPHGSTLGDAAQLLLDTSQHDFPVLHAEQVIGLLTRSSLMEAIHATGPESYVSTAMNRDFVTVSADLDLSDALPLMAEAGHCAVVMERGRLVGLLTAENIGEYFALRSARRET
jgi:CBS domain-containing protein